MSRFVPQFQKGDKVLVSGPLMGRSRIIRKPRPAEVLEVDDDDPRWPYRVAYETPFYREHDNWVGPDALTTALVKPPKFKTQAEADAWLEKHSPTGGTA